MASHTEIANINGGSPIAFDLKIVGTRLGASSKM
jgi:hypothetical protein